MTDMQKEFITFMVESGALTFGDFVTKSGRRTPYFINTGNYRTGAQAARLGDYYAACIQENAPQGVSCLFGPAYKGIPLAVCAAASLYRLYGRDVPYCFNRKEAKDHGEGGSLVGYQVADGDTVAIVEDVVTAGTAVGESLAFFRSLGRQVEVRHLFVSVDRRERGTGDKTTLEELGERFGIQVHPIVTIHDIVAFLYGREIGGRVVVDDRRREQIEAYLAQYGPRG